MPLSRQTSRIVWPSKPSTTRPSTSIRIRGDDCGRCGDCVSSRRLGERDRLAGGAAIGARDEVSHGSPYRIAPAATAIGWQTPAGQALFEDVLVQLGPEVSHPAGQRKRRQPLVVAQAGGSTMSADRSLEQLRGRSAAAGPRRSRSPISTRRRVPIRHGIVLPHASSAQKRVRRRARSTMQARSSATTTEPEPTCAPTARRVLEVVRRVEHARAGAGRRTDHRRGPP